MIIRADKITVARGQLDTAIELILGDKDIISSVVLVHSAWSVLKDLLKVRNIKSSRSWMPELLSELSENEVWKKIDQVWNFSKHAKGDPESFIEFKADYIEGALCMALYDFSQIGKQSRIMDIYQLWFIAKNKELFGQHKIFLEAERLFPDMQSKGDKEQKELALRAIGTIE